MGLEGNTTSAQQAGCGKAWKSESAGVQGWWTPGWGCGMGSWERDRGPRLWAAPQQGEARNFCHFLSCCPLFFVRGPTLYYVPF